LPEYEDYLLCEKFGWTPEELDRQDSQVIRVFLKIMELESKRIRKEQSKIKDF